MAGARHSKEDTEHLKTCSDHMKEAMKYLKLAGAPDEDGDGVPDVLENSASVEDLSALAAGATVDERYAVKSLGDGRIGCYAVLFGDETTPDLSPLRDYFTKSTDYWLERLGPVRPMTYEHGQDDATKAMPVVGVFDKAEVRDLGVWLEGQLDTAHRYYEAVKWLIDNGKLGASSEALPSYVQRRQRANKAHEITVWPLAACTLTTHPADYRQTGSIETIKSAYLAAGLNLDIPATDEPEAASAGATAQSDEARARRISLELDLLAL